MKIALVHVESSRNYDELKQVLSVPRCAHFDNNLRGKTPGTLTAAKRLLIWSNASTLELAITHVRTHLEPATCLYERVPE